MNKFVSSMLGANLLIALMVSVQAQNADTKASSPDAPAPTGLFVKFRVKPGKNAAFEAAFRQMQQSMREKEPGALYYDLFVTPEDPQLYVIMERYRDAAAVTAHGQTEHMQKVLAELREVMDGPPVPQRLVLISAKRSRTPPETSHLGHGATGSSKTMCSLARALRAASSSGVNGCQLLALGHRSAAHLARHAVGLGENEHQAEGFGARVPQSNAHIPGDVDRRPRADRDFTRAEPGNTTSRDG